MSLGQNIRIYREKLGLSQTELAKKLGYKDRSTIAKIESDVNDLTQSKIVAIADALETSPAALMGWEKEQPTVSDGLAEAQQSLIAYAKTLTEEQAVLALRVLKSVVGDDQ